MTGIIKKKAEVAAYWGNVFSKYLYIVRKCAPFYRYMLDEESKRIMRLRQRFLASPNIEQFIKGFVKEDMNFEIPELATGEGKNIILCLMEENATAVQYMNCTKILLDHSKWRNSYRCVNLKDNFVCGDEDIIVPVWGEKLDIDSLNHKLGKDKKIHIPQLTEMLTGVVGKQYFDVFGPCQNETVVDCGAFDGTTELEIAQWSNYTYKKIYAFEPNQANCQRCIQFYKENALRDIDLIPKGTWSESTILSFSVEGDEVNPGGGVNQNGTEKVPVTTIDDVVGNETVTFIKMDVEGAELESLKGAAKTIKRDCPKLAVCIYHKFDDMWVIPEYILSLNNSYRFYIRHYISHTFETVLYAITM